MDESKGVGLVAGTWTIIVAAPDEDDEEVSAPRPGSEAWLLRECELRLRSFYSGASVVLPLEAELAIVCLESGYTRRELGREDARFVRVLLEAARHKRAAEARERRAARLTQIA